MNVSDQKHEQGSLAVNPSWVIQTLILCLMAISGYFIQQNLSVIREEIQFSRLERAQLRADMSALEIGLRGDRFTRTDWNRERERIEEALDTIRERLSAMEER